MDSFVDQPEEEFIQSSTSRSRVRLSYLYRKLINLFKKECQDLVLEFQEKSSESFEDFIQLWTSHKFHLIYEKYAKNGPLQLIKEDSLLIAKNIMLHAHFLGGLFLLYGLFFIQEDPRSLIRIEKEEFQKLMENTKIERINLIETGQPGFMVAKLLKNEAFAFVGFAQDFSIENQSRYRIVQGNKIRDGANSEKIVKPKDWLNSFLVKVDFLDEIKKVDEEYFKKKHELKNSHPELNLALNLVPDDLVTELKQTLLSLDADPTEPDIGTARQRIKNKQSKKKTRYWNAKEAEDVKYQPIRKLRSSSVVSTKRRGPPKGKRKFFFKSAVNDPESPVEEEEEEEEVSSEDENILAMPDI